MHSQRGRWERGNEDVGNEGIVSAVVLVVFVLYEGRRQSMPRLWVPIVATLCVGVSFGLPLFLFFREQHLEQKRAGTVHL